MAEEKSNQVPFKSVYYDMSGKAGSIRLAEALGGISFQDEIITMEQP